MELKLQSYKVPYKVSGGQSFFSRTEIKDIMAYLKILLNPADDNAFLRIVNTLRREIGAAILEKMVNYANQRGDSLIRAWIEHLSQKSQQEDAIASVRQMVREMEYQDWLLQTSSGPPMANVETLISSLQTSLEKAVVKNDNADMGDAVARLVLMDLLERQEEEDETDRVQMMTLHSAKGLEFPHVFLMGMEEELLPHRNAGRRR